MPIYDADEETQVTRRAFPVSQGTGPDTFRRATLSRVGSFLDVGWYDTAVHPEPGACALVRIGGPYEGLVGEILRLSYQDREVFVLVQSTADLEEDLCVTRRAFMALAPLWAEAVPCIVELTV